MEHLKIPKNYESALSLHDTQVGIKTVKEDVYKRQISYRGQEWLISNDMFVFYLKIYSIYYVLIVYTPNTKRHTAQFFRKIKKKRREPFLSLLQIFQASSVSLFRSAISLSIFSSFVAQLVQNLTALWVSSTLS